jgi:hypothetical protein
MRAFPGIRAPRAEGNQWWLAALAVAALALPQAARGQPTAGTEGPPADQSIVRGTPGVNSTISIIPAGPTGVSNCIPFGDNTDYGFTGFMYRNVPPFSVTPGSQISFDLGNQNDQAIRRNIYFAVANMNPGPPVVIGIDLASQGISALGWTQVVSDAQVPTNPTGNFVMGDYELTYTVEAAFNFPGGGLIVGFAGSPPAGYPDNTCDQVLVVTTAPDSSGLFYGRFFGKLHLTLGVLDDPPSGGNAVELGGIVIREEVTPVQASSWGTVKIRYR